MAPKKRRKVVVVDESGKKVTAAMAVVEFDYEQVRNARIEENRKRMEELGLFVLKKEVSVQVRTKIKRPRPQREYSRVSTSAPRRRSTRLQHIETSVNYTEVDEDRPQKACKLSIYGEQPEIYTKEHEKLLGLCKTEWVIGSDVCGPDGKRIYDHVKGKTCHQCRQKTLGLRTHCSSCDLVQGQLCGDCLYTRYGENVIEANENPNWICPVCRGICNCSLCRIKKGWQPTFYLYNKVRRLGFKSVAHYLILTKRAAAKSESADTPANNIEDNKKNDVTLLTGAKRSLTFASDPIDCNAPVDENTSLPTLLSVKKEKNDSLPNLASCDSEQEPNGEIIEGSSTCDTKRQHVEDDVATTQKKVSVTDPTEDKNNRKLLRRKVYKKGGIAERLRPRSSKNTGS